MFSEFEEQFKPNSGNHYLVCTPPIGILERVEGESYKDQLHQKAEMSLHGITQERLCEEVRFRIFFG